MEFLDHIIISFLNKKTVEVLVGPVSMWITYFLQWKHSLSTCGQTVHKLVQVIHSCLKLSTTHLALSFASAAEDQIAIA
jgi:hypothetical protein